jgi:hypothetical protein
LRPGRGFEIVIIFLHGKSTAYLDGSVSSAQRSRPKSIGANEIDRVVNDKTSLGDGRAVGAIRMDEWVKQMNRRRVRCSRVTLHTL